MPTLAREVEQVGAENVRFIDDILIVTLTDGREIRIPLDRVGWLRWLAQAPPEKRTKWSIEPGGFAVYWDDLDDGIEVCHLLTMQPIA